MSLTDYDALTFDCYGTLIDWEAGILAALEPLLARGRPDLDPDPVLAAFGRIESEEQAAAPGALYPEILARVHRRLAAELEIESTGDEAATFGRSVADWPAFDDSPGALAELQQHYLLVVLSNVDRQSFAASQARLGVTFDAVFTAQDIGSYKPDRRNFLYMMDQLATDDVPAQRILHTAQSLYHDHVPAKELGLATAWIDRRGGRDRPGHGGATRPPEVPVEPDYRFVSLAEMADAVRSRSEE